LPLQKRTISRKLRKMGIEPDTVDLDAILDPTLTYRENWENVLKAIGKGSDRTIEEDEAEAQRREFLEREAERFEDERSAVSRGEDEHKAAKKVLKLSEENLEKWEEHPDEYDIEGVDYRIEGIVANYGSLELTGDWGVVSILGMRGMGKTYLLEHTTTNTEHIVWIDPTGALRPKKVEVLKIDVMPPEEQLSKIVERAITKKRAVVLDISDLKREQMVKVADVIADTIMRTAKRTGRTYTVVADEIGEYIEQEKQYYAPEFERMARVGRNYGVLWLILATQRPQKVNKHVLALSDYYIIFRLLHNRDLEAVKELMGVDSKTWKAIRSGIVNQNRGEYLIFDGKTYAWVRGGRK